VLHNLRGICILFALAGAGVFGTPAWGFAQLMGGVPPGSGTSAGGYGTSGFYQGYTPFYGSRGLWGSGAGSYWGPASGYYPYNYGNYYPNYGALPFASPSYRSGSPDMGIYGTILDPGMGPAGYKSVHRTAPAFVTVTVPVNAKVWFNESPTTSIGTVREFHTPLLQAGGSYTYTVRAAWEQDGQPVSQVQTVSVVPGENARVAFPKPGQ
jgi:uncharacterized protein (TIGR03000 family)